MMKEVERAMMQKNLTDEEAVKGQIWQKANENR
jgi:hypothetical protein